MRPFQRARGVERPPWRAGTGREALPEGQQELRGPPGGLGGVWMSSQWVGSGREALPVDREVS